MHYIKIANGLRKSLSDIREENPNMSIPEGADLTHLGYEIIHPAPLPTLSAGEYVTAGALQKVGDTWIETWDIHPGPTEAEIVAAKVERLWQAADSYTSGYISGVAIGILTIGVMLGKPKCLAVAAWSGAVWAEYYRRKSLVTATSDVDYYFSAVGSIPHSVPELQAEVGM